jgi:hypothetical protein
MMTKETHFGGKGAYIFISANADHNERRGRFQTYDHTASGLSITFPDARKLRRGEKFILYNQYPPANLNIALKNNVGGTIGVGGLVSSQTSFFYLVDNSTQAGVWGFVANSVVFSVFQGP